MPELTGEVTRLSLLVTLGVAAVGIAAFCLGLTMAARRFPPATVWLASGVVVGAVVVFAFVRIYLQPLAWQELDLRSAAFFLAVLLGLPSAVAVWLAVRRALRPVRSTLLVDTLLAAAGLIAVVPIAAIIASIPDALSLFG